MEKKKKKSIHEKLWLVKHKVVQKKVQMICIRRPLDGQPCEQLAKYCKYTGYLM